MGQAKEYLIGLDLGTSAIKGVLMSSEGSVVSRAKEPTRYMTYEDGRKEFDADEFYGLVAKTIRRLAGALPEGAFVAGVSMASASGNTLILDGYNRPLVQAVSWMDSRVTGSEMDEVLGKLDAVQVYRLVGWPYIRQFPLAQLAWLRYHKPELLDKAKKVCMSTDYVNYRLTGEWGIDPSTATTFYLQEQEAGRWYAPFLDKLGIDESKLPPICSSGSVVGTITEAAAADTGLKAGTPVVLGAFDHPCAARGSGVLKVGQMLISCGTSWVGFYPVDNRQKALGQTMLVDPFLQPDGPWGAMFSLPAIAEKVDKYICRYISDAPDRYKDFDRLAAQAEPAAGGLIINPMGNLNEDEINKHPKADIARALMEGTAFLLKSKMEQFEAAGFKANSVVMVGGPSETYPWPQIVCDVLGLELSTINGSCAGAAGAAILAGVSVGLYHSVESAFENAKFEKITRVPGKEASRAYEKAYGLFKAACQCR